MASRRILIADDESYLTEILSFHFKKLGDQITVVNDGDAALAAALKEPPDLVITDYQMRELDGIELCTRLKEAPQTAQLPAIMLTARGHLVPPEQIAKTNIRLVMSKPFSARELLLKVERIIGPAVSGAVAPRRGRLRHG